jgi:uncharacterized repeat protein (TIGR03803 family)
MTNSLLVVVASCLLPLTLTSYVSAQTVTSIYSFHGRENGSDPVSGLISDSSGNLYGLTFSGGGSTNCLFGSSCGTVYELSYSDGTYTESVIHSFTGGPEDGASPQGPSLSFGPDGDLYGTTYGGGFESCLGGCGTVYRLIPSNGTPNGTPNGTWTEEVLYRFTGGDDGALPFGGVIFDKQGNLYGTASAGGANLAGTVFELQPTSTGFTETTVYTFGGGNYGLASPGGTLVQDADGNFYGEAQDGGTHYGGGIFKLEPSASGFTERPLYAFCALANCADGATPYGGLFLQRGRLYGMANSGGDRNCYGEDAFCGLVFELTPTASGLWQESVLHTFTGGADGAVPFDGPVLDDLGDLYGTTYFGGAYGVGNVFRLAPGPNGWTEQVLYSFHGGARGQAPSASVLVSGTSLFTTAEGEGIYGDGAVIEISK